MALTSQQKRTRGGFAGCATLGYKVVVLGMLDMATRTATGDIRLVRIKSATQRAMRRESRGHAIEVSLVFAGLRSIHLVVGNAVLGMGSFVVRC